VTPAGPHAYPRAKMLERPRSCSTARNPNGRESCGGYSKLQQRFWAANSSAPGSIVSKIKLTPTLLWDEAKLCCCCTRRHSEAALTCDRDRSGALSFGRDPFQYQSISTNSTVCGLPELFQKYARSWAWQFRVLGGRETVEDILRRAMKVRAAFFERRRKQGPPRIGT